MFYAKLALFNHLVTVEEMTNLDGFKNGFIITGGIHLNSKNNCAGCGIAKTIMFTVRYWILAIVQLR
jgi:hypothetical protein